MAQAMQSSTGARPFSLDGMVALVTGSSRGIGHAIAGALADAGATVVIHGRNLADLERIADRFKELGRKAVAVAADVADEEAVNDALKQVLDQQGRLDVLVNNAGLAQPAPLLDTSSSIWRDTMRCNVDACFYLAREAGRSMVAQGFGRIINIASIAGLMAARDRSAYVASKHAVVGLTRALAVELGGEGVTSNAIAPGFIATDMNARLRQDQNTDAWVKSRNALGRWGRVEEVAFAAVYLASPEAAFVNGAVLCVDGGMSAAVH